MKQEGQGEPSSLSKDGHRRAPQPRQRLSARKALFGVIIFFVVAALIAVAGIVPRVRARSVLKDQTDALAPPDVMVHTPEMEKPSSQLVLPGNVDAYTDSPIYARTNGYLQKWYFDIGAHVRKGELLAVISSPEVDQQLSQARADLATAQANASLAKTNAARYQGLLTENAVSKQDTDTFVSQKEATSSAVKSAEANVQRLEELQSFEKVYAPFDGVITARNVDIGQLINEGAGQQMFRMAAVNTLRVYVNIPQVYSRGAVPGTVAQVAFSQFPGQSFPGKLVRTASAIDPTSRTLLAEFDVDNRAGKLAPGSFAEVHINLDAGIPTLVIPVTALIFRAQGLQVGTAVKGPNGETAKLVPVTVGEDDGTKVQILTGLDRDSQVIQNPPDSLVDGEPVRVVQPQGKGSQGAFSQDAGQ